MVNSETQILPDPKPVRLRQLSEDQVREVLDCLEHLRTVVPPLKNPLEPVCLILTDMINQPPGAVVLERK